MSGQCHHSTLDALLDACSAKGEPNRYVCETIFKHVWQGGAPADDAARLQALTQQLSTQRAVDAVEVKDELKANTEEAIARGVFGVPTSKITSPSG